MVKVRPARGLGMTLEEAMESAVEVRDWREMMTILRWGYHFWSPTDANVTVEKYGTGTDKRCGWDTHLVCVDGKAALFASGPIAKEGPHEDQP